MKFVIYHGTSMKNALNIQENREFISQSKINHWLGNGVYFFVNDPDAAEWWGNMKSSGSGAVMYTEIEIDESEILDLDTLTGANILNEFYDNVVENNIDFNYTEKEKKFLKRYPREEQHVQMSKLLESLYGMFGYKACIYSFSVSIQRLKIVDVGFIPQERQINLLDNKLINFDTLSIDKV